MADSAVVDMKMEPAQAKSLPVAVVERGLSRADWNTLCRSLYPGANPNSVLLVVDYCKARKLDPLKKPCHIVPMQVKDARTNTYEWRDVVMPGIYEIRTTAQRTGEYLGHDKAQYGPMEDFAGVTAPVSCSFTVYRWNAKAGEKAAYPVEVFFRECVATKRDGTTNERWRKAPIQMLTKCAEAAALREAFPDELGGQQTAEEMDGRLADAVEVEAVPVVKAPDGFTEFVSDLESAAVNGSNALTEAWTKASEALRMHMAQHHSDMWERLGTTAKDVDAMASGAAE